MIFLNIYSIMVFITTGLLASDFSVERWRVIEIDLISSRSYSAPFYDVDVDATFTSSNGTIITRPAFWDGDSTWKIRFTPTEIGLWAMVTNSTDTINSGLHQATKTIECISYEGDLDIYKNGFLKVSNNGRYFTYENDIPFFYLGDTHWILPHERFDTSNVPDIASQFKYTVDKRVSQGFTVYQSEPIWQPHAGGTHDGDDEENFAVLSNGFSSADLDGFVNLDRKFKYIADQGLVHANAQVDWATNPANVPEIYTEEYMARIAKYWVARYGAYPVIWTIAQEIDNNMYDAFTSETINRWFAVGLSIIENDNYNHPILPHMEDASQTTWENSWWSDKPFHDGWAIQWQGEMSDVKLPKGFWNNLPTKPSILYEGQYDQFWTNSRAALGFAYKSFQYGIYGYGYGASGVWNDIYSKPGDPPDYGTGYQMPEKYFWWFDGANLETGDQLTHFKKFYTNLEWWKLIPRFDDLEWGTFADKKRSLLSSDEINTFVVFFFSNSTSTGAIKKMESDSTYVANWFNPRDGQYTVIDTFAQNSTEWLIPERPSAEDWILLVKKKHFSVTNIDNKKSKVILNKFELEQNYPNPFNPSTVIKYSIPVVGTRRPATEGLPQITLKIYDILGHEVTTLVNKEQKPGDYKVQFDASGLTSGIYLYKLNSSTSTGSVTKNMKMILLK